MKETPFKQYGAMQEFSIKWNNKRVEDFVVKVRAYPSSDDKRGVKLTYVADVLADTLHPQTLAEVSTLDPIIGNPRRYQGMETVMHGLAKEAADRAGKIGLIPYRWSENYTEKDGKAIEEFKTDVLSSVANCLVCISEQINYDLVNCGKKTESPEVA